MKKRKVRKLKYFRGSVLASVGIAVLVLALFWGGINRIDDISRKQELLLTEQAVRKAAIQCYAVEGIYPARLSYLEENYYLRIDSDHYYVSYNCVSSNFMPDIEVFER
ncbi:hypothetical protein HNQ56_001401 [Anaerotaenia torta]|uniref:hypothetical protein n=1 Tax=Anaerotaenia torta TaxID=433293 RepID=UPI003D1EC347